MTSDADFTPTEPTPEESLVPVFSSSNHDAEMEALTIKGILDANGIPALIAGPHVLPNLEFQVQVPEHLVTDAQAIINEARAAGPAAAAEAEAMTEGNEPPAV